MKRFLVLTLSIIMICLVTSCSAPKGDSDTSNNSSKTEVNVNETEETTENYLSVTDVTGKTLDTAKATLEADGFIVVTVEENSDTVEEGLVIRQEPTPENNLKLKKGDTVTLYLSKGKLEDEKVYLDTMGYTFHNSTCSYNNWAPFQGEDGHGNACEHAYQFYINSNIQDYINSDDIEKSGLCSYKVSFDLNKKYKIFNFNLTAGERLDTESAKITITGDDNHLYGNGITEKTNQTPVSIDVTNVETLTFEISVGTTSNTRDSHYIILNNAYFE